MPSRLLLLTGVLLGVVGCAPGMDSIDREVQSLIQQRQAQSLGGDRSLDPQIVPDARPRDPRPASDLRHPRPGTLNPASTELDIRPSTRTIRLDQPPETREYSEEELIELDLEGALRYAIRQSPTYRNRREQLYIAALDLLVEKHLWGPRFFETFSATVSGAASGDEDHALSVIQEFRVTQRLPYGGSVSARALVNYVQQLSTAAGSTAEDSQSTQLVLSVTQPLLRGAGAVAREDLILAERRLIYASRSFETFRREFLVDVSSRYYELLRNQAEIRNLTEQQRNLNLLTARTKALADAGRVPVIEVQRAEQELLFAANNLTSRRERYQSAVDQFKLLIGMPVQQPLRILPAEVMVPIPELDVVKAVEAALRYRLDLQTAWNQVEDAKRRVELARNLTLPELNLFADLRLNTDSDRQYGGLQFSGSDSTYAAGLRFESELPTRNEHIRLRAQIIEYERAYRAYELQRDRVIQDVRESVRAIDLARFTVALQERNIELAQRRKRGVEIRGLGGRDFIEAQERLLNAQDRRDEALRDLRINVLRFLLNSGQLRVSPQGQWEMPGSLVVPLDPDGAPAPDAQPAQEQPQPDIVVPEADEE